MNDIEMYECGCVPVSFIYGNFNFTVRSNLYLIKYESPIFFIQLCKPYSYLTEYSKSCSDPA